MSSWTARHMSTARDHCVKAQERPVVWYLAAGYRRAGGVEVYLLHYASEMRRQGFDTRIVVFEPLPWKKHRCLVALEQHGIRIESLFSRCMAASILRAGATWLPCCVRNLLLGRKWLRPRDLLHWCLKGGAVRRLARMVERERPDVIHVKGRLLAEAWDVLPAERTIFHVATSGEKGGSFEKSEVDALTRFVQSAARVFAPGSGVAETFKREFGVDRDVDVIFTMAPDEARGTDAGCEMRNMGCELRGTALRESVQTSHESHITINSHNSPSLRFGTLCRLVEHKGISETLEVLVRHKDECGEEIPFVFAGTGPLAEMIRETVDREQLTEVSIKPVTSPADALQDMDVFVLASDSEAMPLVIVEALMCGKPCIVTRVGGVPDLIRDGVEGVLIDPGSVEQIEKAMNYFSAMPKNQLTPFGLRARKRYEEKCQPSKVGAIVAQHYRDIIGR